MTTVLKKALVSNGANFDNIEAIEEFHAQERHSNKKRHYFLGGLLHINGFEIDGALTGILRDYTQTNKFDTTTYIVTINLEKNGIEASIGETADQMHNLKNEPMTNEGVEASHLIMGNDELLDAWAAMDRDDAVTAMEDHFSQIVLTGYSYGTSLIQQMERDIVHRLRQRHLPLTPLNNVNAVNMGPVDIPACDKGLHAEFNNVSGKYEGKRQGFTQLFVLKHNDKIMSNVIDRRLVPENKEAAQIVSYGEGRLNFVVDYTSGADIRRVGVSKFAEGREVPRAYMNYDPEAHDIRVYLNRKAVVKGSSGTYVTYPSSPLSNVARTAMEQALSGQKISEQPLHLLAQQSMYDYNSLALEFKNVVNAYELASYPEAVANLKQLIEETQAEAQKPVPKP